ncbi:MAG TPA: hypothetical protein VH157_07115 [Bryobacteraceae bacterium]|nr:hypothetical protein [Bryobacteraceae bacterium]
MPVHGKHHPAPPEAETHRKQKTAPKSVLPEPVEVSKGSHQTAAILEDPHLEQYFEQEVEMSAVAPPPPNGAEELLASSQQSGPTQQASLAGTAYVAPPTDPSGVTRFSGPVYSGKTNPGMTLLSKRVYIDASKGGSFNAQITFPAGAILLWAGVSVLTAFAPVGATVSIGLTSGAADVMASAAVPTSGTVMSAPIISALANGIAWFNYAAGASTAGKATVFLVYLWPQFPGTEVG